MKSSVIETRISGSFYTRFWLELFTNSAYFPIANIFFELLSEGTVYFHKPDLYTLTTSTVIQSYWLACWQITSHPRRMLGNLIGPALYSTIEFFFEGIEFFDNPNHWTYWIVSIGIGILQALRFRLPARFKSLFLIAENIVRITMVFGMYALFEAHGNYHAFTSFASFWKDPSHTFIALTLLFLGLMIGLANATAEKYLSLLKETSAQLRTYSIWLLGRDLLEKSFTDPSVFSLIQRERFILFMDIRGFTHWSETCSPNHVAKLLSQYYKISETVFSHHHTIKFKFSADEVMAVFPTVESAVLAALELSREANQLLASEHLGAGIGLHGGSVVEGLLGSTDISFYDVIGDTVNTAKRIESAAQSGEVLISESVYEVMGQAIQVGPAREIIVKGKTKLLTVYPLQDKSTG